MLPPSYKGTDTIALPRTRITLTRASREGMSLLVNWISTIMLIERHHSAPIFNEEIFALERDLTSAEVRAARGAVVGMTADDIAQQTGLSREPIRCRFAASIAELARAARQNRDPFAGWEE